MGNKQSTDSSDYYDSQNHTSPNMLQTGGNANNLQNIASNPNQILNLDLSDLQSDSENDYDAVKYGGSNNYNNYNSEDSVRTEDFVNLLKSKIANLPNQTNQLSQTYQTNQTNQLQTINLSLSESDLSDTSVFLSTDRFNNTNVGQTGGNLNDDTDVDTIMRIAKEYLRQHGGGSEETEDSDSDEDLDDSDEDSETDDKKEPKRSTKKIAKNQSQRSINKMSESVSSESVTSNKYKTGSSESFGSSSALSNTSVSNTPYIESESIRTSSINLVSFENPALTTNLKKSKSKSKRQSKY